MEYIIDYKKSQLNRDELMEDLTKEVTLSLKKLQ